MMRNFFRNHSTLAVVLLTCISLLGLVGYQVWAYQTSQANAEARAKVHQLTSAQCVSTKAFYVLLNGLVLDTSPHYGSPQGGKIVPGARTKAINHLFQLERKSIAKLKTQGCDVSGVVPADIP